MDRGGPADGVLRDGDVITAVDGRRVVSPLTPEIVRQFVLNPYPVTVRRGGSEETILLTFAEEHSEQQRRVRASLVFGGVVWCLLATSIALLRPDQRMVRRAYVAGTSMGLFLLAGGNIGLEWASRFEQLVAVALFPIGPMHVFFQFDFCLHFPTDATTGRLWRSLRAAAYALCGIAAVRSLARSVAFAAGPDAYFAVLARLPLRIWFFPIMVGQGIAGVGGIAVLVRNYRTLPEGDARRRLRWLVWGTMLAAAP